MSTTQKTTKTTARKPDRTISFPHEKLKDLIISHLYATSYLNDDEEVTNLVFKTGIDIKNTIRLDLYLKKNTKNNDNQLELVLGED